MRRRLAGLYSGARAAVRGAPPGPGRGPRIVGDGVTERRTVLIDRPRREVYRQLEQLERLPRFLDHLSTVIAENGRITRWTVGHGAHALRWRVHVVEDIPGERIAWESLPGGDLIAEGSITFTDGKRGGTIVDLTLRYVLAPGVPVPDARLLERLNGRRLARNLRTLRELIEADCLDPRAAGADRVARAAAYPRAATDPPA